MQEALTFSRIMGLFLIATELLMPLELAVS